MQPARYTGEHTPEERQQMLDGMKEVASAFYAAATRIGNHAFIEFTGFMNEYRKLCAEAHAQGHDFTKANVHNGQALFAMEPHHARYLGEKFGCIFETSFAGRWPLVEVFIETAFGLSRHHIRAQVVPEWNKAVKELLDADIAEENTLQNEEATIFDKTEAQHRRAAAYLTLAQMVDNHQCSDVQNDGG